MEEATGKMPIPSNQLETWSHPGSIIQSAQTYAAVKRALEAASAPYTDRTFTVFLQGSYGNDTNIYAESDVDVVIRYDGAFYYDVSQLPAGQAAIRDQAFGPGDYPYDDFKRHVQTALTTAFGAAAVTAGTKAIKISANSSRRSADVVVAFEHLRYHRFISTADDNHVTGISFFDSAGMRIDNFPDQHSENLTAKHQATTNRFKPTIRMFKNMRKKLVDDNVIEAGIAPSYYIEGLLYNVPNDKFVWDESGRIYNILKWLEDTTDRSKFLCANEQYYLFWENSPTSWPKANGEAFINAVTQLWNTWA